MKMLNKLRPHVSGKLERLGLILAKHGVKPTHVSLAGFLLALLSIAPLILLDRAIGTSIFITMIILSGAADALDGSIARASGTVSRKGSLLDSVLDRLTDTLILLYIYIGGVTGNAALVILLVATSLIISYIRSKAESLGVEMSGVGLMERGERIMMILIAVATHLFNPIYTEYILTLLLILNLVTITQRLHHAWKSLS